MMVSDLNLVLNCLTDGGKKMRGNNKQLTIYQASAGSGKTFTLVVEYLCLLVSNPHCHEQILAVTFTNKATEEMKMRIISQLYGISHSLKSSAGYLDMINKKTGVDKDEIINCCNTALHYILHHYNKFRIQTIDAFFQTVFRNMARELDLPPNLRVDLDDTQVEEKAVDELISSLIPTSTTLKLIREYISSNMQDEKNWNVINDIKKFGKNIFKDFYKNHEEDLNRMFANTQLISNITKTIRQQLEGAKTAWKQEAWKLLDALSKNGCDSPDYFKFKNKGTVWSYIHNIQTFPKEYSQLPKRVQSFLDEPTAWVDNSISDFAINILCPMLNEFEKQRQQIWSNYQSAKLTLNNLYQLRLLNAIDIKVKEINNEANRFQLSNTQSLLKAFIQDSDTPFIYEKIGAYLRYIMIDEFQDTSRMQWDNFKVLLMNNMSDVDSKNFIVGDVKQSIYRWRGGDWQLLNNIMDEFTGTYGQWRKNVETIPLKYNYRSMYRIVEFNNHFFKYAIEQTLEELQSEQIANYDQLQTAYSALHQNPNKKEETGLVRVELHDNGNTYNDAVLDSMLKHIDILIDYGVQSNDIAILTRSNNEIDTIVNYFTTERSDLQIVSGEAFLLDSSLTVNILIFALRLIVDPSDDLSRYSLVKAYTRYVVGSDMSETDILLTEDINSLLPKRFVEDNTLAKMSLTDLVDTLYNIFTLDKLKNQGAYISKFNDILSDYVFENTSDINSFLKAWEEKLHKEKIQSDIVDGIRIMTIHKSKGLEFKHVIVPYCSWTIEKTNTIWCENIQGNPYNQFPVIPITTSGASVQGTIFEQEYKKEHLQNVVDNMNLLYVAFTRAENSLLVIGQRKKPSGKQGTLSSNNRSAIMEQILTNLSKELAGSTITEDTDNIVLEWGDLASCVLSSNPSGDKTTDNVFDIVETPQFVQAKSYTSFAEFRQSNKSLEFVKPVEELTATTDYIQLGNILHQLFSNIRTEKDIEPRLRELELEGVLYSEDLTPDIVRNKIRKALSNPDVKQWFTDGWRLFNERTILITDPATHQITEYRPDRVMVNEKETVVIDFKFGSERQEYVNQVKNYMQLIAQMGYTNVKGYLWYVMRNKSQKITI